jgi:hypothetical protein
MQPIILVTITTTRTRKSSYFLYFQARQRCVELQQEWQTQQCEDHSLHKFNSIYRVGYI